MKINNLLRASAIVFAVLMLGGCPSGGTDDNVLGGGGSGSETTGGGTTGGSNTSGTTTQQTVTIGSFDSTGVFIAGTVGTNKTSLQAGESASLSVSLRDQDGNAVTDAVDIFFTSPCIGADTSEVDPAVATNSSGTVSVTYTARGCDGTDKVLAQTSVDGSTLSATVSLQTTQPPLGAISFDSVSRDVIGLKGSGAIPEQAVVNFKVTNATGGPVANQVVDFTLNTTNGGITLSNSQDTTDANGIASTTVSSGTVATTVRVTATATRDGTTTSAQSSGLAISTGLPDQDSFSISTETFNIEGWDLDGITTEITIRAADRFNNPVPDGTAISFTTEGGSIEPNCLTTSGACSVTFTSQAPRPLDGRVTVLAHAIGEETFKDTSPSNSAFDDAEASTLGDLPEAFRDDNENGTHDSGSEISVDFDSDSNYDGPDSLFNGVLCNGPGLCSAQKSLTVFNNIVIVLSDSDIAIGVTPSPINLDGGTVSVIVTLAGFDNGQVPAAGSDITVSTSQGSIVGTASFEMRNTAYDPAIGPPPGPFSFATSVKPGTAVGNGEFTVKVVSPNGVISEASVPVTQTVVP